MNPHGLIVVPRKPEDYVHGDHLLGDQALNYTGQWEGYLPVAEDQNTFSEPEACTSYGTLNAIEVLLRHEFGATENLSDRFLAFTSGTTQAGNDPHKVAETLRKGGDVYEADWPYTFADNSWSTFYQKPPQSLILKALEFSQEFALGHSWVNTDPASMMNALTFSPLGAGGYAWATDKDGLYYTPPGAQPTHWFMVYGYVEGKYWKAFDSYSPEVKRLRWDYNFAMCKRYTLHRQIVSEMWWQKFLTIFNAYIESVRRTLGLQAL